MKWPIDKGMKTQILEEKQMESRVGVAAALVMAIFVVATMGFSGAAFRLSEMQPRIVSLDTDNHDLLANREVFNGVDTSFAAYQNAIQR